MKNLKLSLCIAATALLTLPTLSLAADEKKPEGKRPGGAGGPGGRFSAEERLKHMTESLGLTQEQQDKVKAILEKDAPKMKELMAKGRENLTEEDKAKMGELMKAQREEIAAILTPEQKEKQKAEMEKRGGRRPGGDKAGEKKPEAK